MTAAKFLVQRVAQFDSASRRLLGFAFMVAVVSALSAATVRAQNTQVTIEGTITSVGSVTGITVGDKYSMVVYYNPTQAPASTNGSQAAYYTEFTLNAVVDDKAGNQSFSAESGEELYVEDESGSNRFDAVPCCSTSTAAGFELDDTIIDAMLFKTDALPTTLELSDFNVAYVVFGSGIAKGNITSIRVVNLGGVVPAFITAGSPDPDGKVPTINGVPGSGVTNLDVSIPLMSLTHGSSYVYTIALQDINFTGTCQASFTLTQIQYNKTVTLDSGKTSTFSCGPGSSWAWDFTGKTIPDFPGPATLTGTVTYGSSKGTTTTTVVIQ